MEETCMENVQSEGTEASEELFGLILENGSSRNLEQIKEEYEKIKKLCTKGMILTHALCLEFVSNQEIDHEKMFCATDKI